MTFLHFVDRDNYRKLSHFFKHGESQPAVTHLARHPQRGIRTVGSWLIPAEPCPVLKVRPRGWARGGGRRAVVITRVPAGVRGD